MPMKIGAVLGEVSLGALRDALRGCGLAGAQTDPSASLMEAIQKMYLVGPPDILFVDGDLAGASALATLRSLSSQPGFANLRIALFSDGEPQDVGGAGPVRTLSRPPSLLALADYLSELAPVGDQGPPRADVPSPPSPAPAARRSEARKAPRKEMAAPCLVWAGALKYPGKLKDISMSGASVVVETEIPLQATATVSVAVPGTLPLKVISFRASVVRKIDGGYGLAFREMDQDTRLFLTHFTGGRIL